MQENFNLALTFSLKWEGNYSFDKDDPGGETMLGITDRRDGLVDRKADIDGDGDGDIPIKDLTLPEVSIIYKREYWDKCGCDKMDNRLAIVCFDSAVNCGVGRTRSWLDELAKAKEKNHLVKDEARWMIQRRTQYYLDLVKKKPALNKYIKGWLNRVNDLSKYVDIVTA